MQKAQTKPASGMLLTLKARFLSGDYAEALAAAEKAKQVLWASAVQI
jgi:hypothetical protein